MLINFLKKIAWETGRGIHNFLLMVSQRIFEWSHGVDVYDQKASEVEGHTQYQMSFPLVYPPLKSYFTHITNKDAIIDVGCGKGKMVYFFSKFSFGKIGGIEYSDELVEIARKNIATLCGTGGRISIFQGDAGKYEGYDEYNYFYLFNPFDDAIMRRFLSKVKESLVREPRELHILYYNPLHQNVLLEEGFQIEKILSSLFPGLVVYKNH